MSGYDIAQMRELLRLARVLGFRDDVRHWEAEIAKAEAQAKGQNR